MASYIKTLKEDNGDITYPQTIGDAVLLSGGGDLESTLSAKADQTTVNSKISMGDVQGSDLSASAKLAILNMTYPVGSIFMSATLSTAAQVATAMGGTWVAWGAGKVPVGVDSNDTDFDTAEETGGEKTHTLIVDEIPSHYHNLGQMYDSYRLTSGTSQPRGVYADYAQAVHTTSIGGGQAHNNLQPYITCYMYKRTA